MPEQTAQQEVLDAIQGLAVNIQDLATHMDERFDGVNGRLDGLEKRVTKIEATMVTKDYLDEKLADQRGDLSILMRKEDTKLKTLIEVLSKRGVITRDDQLHILNMEPFPQSLI